MNNVRINLRVFDSPFVLLYGHGVNIGDDEQHDEDLLPLSLEQIQMNVFHHLLDPSLSSFDLE